MNALRLLVISHNPFGEVNNMGKTLSGMFCTYPSDKIAQLYFTDELPDAEFCKRYFRITDFDVAKALLGKRKCGTEIHQRYESGTQRSEIKKAVINHGKKRTQSVYFVRNTMWRLGAWRSKQLSEWLDEFSPQAVFFASGDYSFSYEVAMSICKDRGIPLYLYACDDFYLGSFDKRGLLGKYNFKHLMKSGTAAFKYSSDYFCICEEMAKAYGELFSKQGKVIYTGSSTQKNARIPLSERARRIIYAGNLELGRASQLIKLGRALKKLNVPDLDRIFVYSGEERHEYLDGLTQENGIEFRGRVTREEVDDLLSDSMYTVHTESFDENHIVRTRYSVSTKIADALASGACIIAFGPRSTASVKYLADNNAAYVIDDECDIDKKLYRLISDEALRKKTVENAIELAEKNHNAEVNRQSIFNTINGEEAKK